MKNLILGVAVLALAGQATVPAAARAPQASAATPQAAQERLVALQGAQNFRDVGGYRTTDGRTVKWGAIYRSAELSHLTPQDIAKLQGLGIGAIHDLRTVDERRSQPTAWTGPGAPKIVAQDYSMDLSAMAKLFKGEPTAAQAREVFAASYPEMLAMQRPQQRALFEDLLKGDAPVVYHCTAGKDRTGLATALVLSALGVPRETILADYELSNRYYTGGVSAAGAEADPRNAAFLRLPPEVIRVFMGVDASYLQAVFDRIDRDYGSVDAYLDRELGVDAADVARLKTLYTE